MRRLHHICIQTDMYDESVQFYTKILGFDLIKESPNFHTRLFNSWLQQGDMMIELQTNKADKKLIEYKGNNKGIVHFCMLVDNIEEEYLRIKNLGFNRFKSKKGEDVYKVENGKLFKILAPEGTIIEIRDQGEI